MNVPCYTWTEQYESAVFELDYEKLKDQAAKAEALIQRRKHELIEESLSAANELQAIAKALQVLTLLKEIANRHVLAKG